MVYYLVLCTDTLLCCYWLIHILLKSDTAFQILSTAEIKLLSYACKTKLHAQFNVDISPHDHINHYYLPVAVDYQCIIS